MDLKEDLKKYVAQLLKREEILSFVKRDYSCYPWSIRSLDRRPRHFAIFYSDREVTVDDVRQAFAKELDGSGRLLGYRAMHKKIRQEHELNVPGDLVNAVMYELDPEGLETRGVAAKKRKPKGHFTTFCLQHKLFYCQKTRTHISPLKVDRTLTLSTQLAVAIS